MIPEKGVTWQLGADRFAKPLMTPRMDFVARVFGASVRLIRMWDASFGDGLCRLGHGLLRPLQFLLS